MSGYPGAPTSGYPGAPPAGYPGAPPAGYPGATPAGQPASGYPGAPPAGYPGAPPAGQPASGYPGAPPAGYPGAPPAGYPGAPPAAAGYAPPQHGASAPGGGYPPRPQGAPPAGYPGVPQQQSADPQVIEWFNAVDTDRSGQIDALELQQALVNGNMSKFSEEACRMMIDMFDMDKTGQINSGEFGSLFSFINQWKGMFEGLDQSRVGTLGMEEFTRAIEQMGYRFSPTFVGNLLNKYSPREKRITLDNFIVASVQIKRLTDSFRTRDTQMNGQANMAYEDFVGLAMGAHK